MTLYKFKGDGLDRVPSTSFAAERIREAHDLQRILRDRIEVISPDTLVISEEYSRWEGSLRRIDLLGLDRNATLVVIELKRTQRGGHMELQALRYAAMVSAMTFDRAVEAYREFLESNELEADPRQGILDFLEWAKPDEERFAQDVRIVLASQDFSKEVTSTVMWLNDKGLDIRCVRLATYKDENQVLLDAQQVIPLPEATDYQVQISEKRRRAQAVGSQVRSNEFVGKRLFPTIEENPRRAGTHGFAAFQIILDNREHGIMYEDWVKTYRKMRPQDKAHPNRHLRWDIDHGWVRIKK